MDELLRWLLLLKVVLRQWQIYKGSARKGLWEFIEGEKAKVPSSEKDTEQMRAALERLEQEDFSLIEYDDVIVRQIVEEIRIVDKQMISIRFLCGMGVCQNV